MLRIHKHKPSTLFLVEGDSNVPYARVVSLMGALQEAGITQLGLVTEPQGAMVIVRLLLPLPCSFTLWCLGCWCSAGARIRPCTRRRWFPPCESAMVETSKQKKPPVAKPKPEETGTSQNPSPSRNPSKSRSKT